MRKIIGLVLLVIGVATLGVHGHHAPADMTDEAQRTGYVIGQYTVNALLIGVGLFLLLKKKK